MAKKKVVKNNFGFPGLYALARNRAGGDWAAGLLLYRVMWRCRSEKKLARMGKEWIAMSRSDWAREAGLSEAEMKNRALPNLRKQAFVTIRAMRLGKTKLLWISLDEQLAFENTVPWDMYDGQLNWKPMGHHPIPYPYQKKHLENETSCDTSETANSVSQ